MFQFLILLIRFHIRLILRQFSHYFITKYSLIIKIFYADQHQKINKCVIQYFQISMQSGLKAIVFGATGAVGRTLVPQLVESDKWSKVLCVARNEPQEWKQYLSKGKLQVQVEKDMDRLFKTEQWTFNGFDAIFVCFGSQVKHGEETFVKVDKTYPLLCADIAIRNKIPHYLLVSSTGGDPSSMLLYLRTKGEVERDLKLKKLQMLSILKPGLIKNRPDARFGQKVAQFFSFLPFAAIECNDLGLSLKGLAQTKVDQSRKSQGKVTVYENSDLLDFVKGYKQKEYPKKK